MHLFYYTKRYHLSATVCTNSSNIIYCVNNW